jgi:single-stranded-DNA-specific exonuclease
MTTTTIELHTPARQVNATGLWKQRTFLHAPTQELASALGCPDVIAQVLAARGIATDAEADAFLHPALESYLDDPATDPGLLRGMDAAVKRIFTALRGSEPILIYGDYDVDGTTATVLLKTTLERIGQALAPQQPARVTYHVPHRIREGYGMQASVLADAAAAGIRLVISVDTGIRAVAEAKEARSLGLDLIVTDHHLPDGIVELPDCVAVVNPTQPGCDYPCKQLCGAAVVFKLAQALLKAAAPQTSDPDAFRARTRDKLIPSFLKLVAIATIADSVPLVGENRTIAALGLAALAKPAQPGLRRLMQLAKLPIDRAPTAAEVAFRIAPRINAAGRMDVASDVVELFLTRDAERAHALAEKLDGLNQTRRDAEALALDAIDEKLTQLLNAAGAYPADCIVLDDPDWHRGVLGILASRVVDRTGRPALVITHANGDAHGSGRSVSGFHLLEAILAADSVEPESPLFHRFGGHAHAVGFSLPTERLPMLRERISAHAASRLTRDVLTPAIPYDAEVTFSSLTLDLFDWTARLAPFGLGNPEPVFYTRAAELAGPPRIIQGKHVSLPLRQSGSSPIPALGWSRGTTDWPALCVSLAPGAPIDLLYKVRRNTGPYATAAFDGLELELCALRPATS